MRSADEDRFQSATQARARHQETRDAPRPAVGSATGPRNGDLRRRSRHSCIRSAATKDEGRRWRQRQSSRNAAPAGHGSMILVNNVVSQSVPHLHLHVIPRNKRDGLRFWLGPRHRTTTPTRPRLTRRRSWRRSPSAELSRRRLNRMLSRGVTVGTRHWPRLPPCPAGAPGEPGRTHYARRSFESQPFRA